jgi:DNA-binding CsgD family transcriptional regulator
VHEGGRGGGTVDGPFVGREDALAVIERARTDALRGEPRFVIIEGPAGVGKTSLVRHALDAHRATMELHVATGLESETLVPFGVVDQLLARLEGRSSGSSGAGRTEPREDAADAGGQLLAALGCASEVVTVLVVDDAQWADVQSLRALAFACRRLEADRVLLVVSARDGLDADSLIARLGEDQRARRIVLGPLSTGEIGALAAESGVQLGAAAATRLRQHTSGLPLHVRALLDELDPTALERSTGTLAAPRSFSTVVLQRLSTAPPSVEALVVAVAVIGERAPVGVATAAAGVDDPIATIDAAVGLGLLEHHRGAAGDELRFVHALIRAAVSDSLAPGRRAEMHRRVADQLSGVEALEHRAAAALVADVELAAELHRYATDEITRGATEMGAHRLLEAARLQPDPETARAWRLEALGALAWGGALGSANDVAAELGNDLASDDPRALYLRGHFALLNMHRSECEQLLRAGWDRCNLDDDAPIASLIATRLAQLYTIFGPEPTPGEALMWSERSFDLVPDDGLGPRAPNGILLVSLALAGRPDEALGRALPEALTAAALARGVRRDTLDNGFDCVLGRGVVKLWTDDLAGARTDLRTAGSSAGGLVPAIWTRLWALGFLADLEYRSGQWDDSAAHADLAISLAEDTDHQWMLGMLHGVAALPAAARGDWEAAAAHVDSARLVASVLDSTISVAFAGTAAAALAAARGDDRAVIEATEPLAALERSRGVMEPGVLHWYPLRIEALARTGRLDEAVALADDAFALAERQHQSSALADLFYARGVLEDARGDSTAAAEAFARGEAEHGNTAMPFRAALHQLAYGTHLRRRGQRRAASARLEDALRTFTELGARPYAERVESELAACGLRPRRRAPAAPVLTPREQAVARLVAEGLTNAEIARQLFVSAKTVEYHLGNAYAKFGVRNRAQLAARIDTLGSDD